MSFKLVQLQRDAYIDHNSGMKSMSGEERMPERSIHDLKKGAGMLPSAIDRLESTIKTQHDLNSRLIRAVSQLTPPVASESIQEKRSLVPPPPTNGHIARFNRLIDDLQSLQMQAQDTLDQLQRIVD